MRRSPQLYRYKWRSPSSIPYSATIKISAIDSFKAENIADAIASTLARQMAIIYARNILIL
jgi:hypothetical protein